MKDKVLIRKYIGGRGEYLRVYEKNIAYKNSYTYKVLELFNEFVGVFASVQCDGKCIVEVHKSFLKITNFCVVDDGEAQLVLSFDFDGGCKEDIYYYLAKQLAGSYVEVKKCFK